MEESATAVTNKNTIQSISLLDYLYVLARRKRFIVRFVGTVALLTVLMFWVILPRWFKATATVMPPKQKNALGLLTSITRATSSLRSLGIGGIPSDDLAEYQTILSSRRVMEDVIGKFNLLEVYDVDTMEKGVKELRSNVEIVRGKEDVSLEIIVYDTNPQRAADIANYFVEVLNKVYTELSVSEARGNRKFLEQRYLKVLADLKNAEEQYKAFQERYRVFSIPDQVKAAVTAAATLHSQIVLKEVELGVLSQSISADNPEREHIEMELRELKKQLRDLETGGEKEANRFIPPLAKAPEIGIEYLRRYRELEIQGKILELLMPLYEQAKIEEQRSTPSVLILDRAVPAEKASKPKRLLLTIAITLFAFLVAFVVSFYSERSSLSQRNWSAAEATKLSFVKKELNWKHLFR
jgi:uncharacterized protein involved in exopolysaccharide biosynthesis